jgi:hypothetical protein
MPHVLLHVAGSLFHSGILECSKTPTTSPTTLHPTCAQYCFVLSLQFSSFCVAASALDSNVCVCVLQRFLPENCITKCESMTLYVHHNSHEEADDKYAHINLPVIEVIYIVTGSESLCKTIMIWVASIAGQFVSKQHCGNQIKFKAK